MDEEKEKCPMECGHYEALMRPKNNPKSEEMVWRLAGITTWLKNNDTVLGLANILLRIIQKFFYDQTERLKSWNFGILKMSF